MKKVKKQSIAIAMVTALSVGAIMSPASVYAQQKDSPNQISDSVATHEGNNILLEADNNAFTDSVIANQAIKDALTAYEFTNQTTEQEVKEFLEQEFVSTRKLSSINYVVLNRTIEATQGASGKIECKINYELAMSDGSNVMYEVTDTYVIPRLPKDGEVAINKANFPDPAFRKYVINNVDKVKKDNVLSASEIRLYATTINVNNNEEIENLEGIKYFTNLQTLLCASTNIKKLDISNNKKLSTLNCNNCEQLNEIEFGNITTLKELSCGNTQIDKIDVISNNRLLEKLECFDTKITQLNVDNNIKLNYLSCSVTNISEFDVSISELDVSKNPELTVLYCANTNIDKLDVSRNTKLQRLNCSSTNIQQLDLSENKELNWLQCTTTQIKSLDVSAQKLTNLYCNNNQFSWINLGDQTFLNSDRFRIPDNSHISLLVTTSSFNIEQIFNGIDVSKITIKSGASLEGNIVSNYKVGTPIRYTYDCGTVNGIPTTLTVYLDLYKEDSEIEVIGSLNKEYTGEPYENPKVKTVGSKGELTFTYYQYDDKGNRIKLNTSPINAGKYSVNIELAEDDQYSGATIEFEDFEITQTKNEWLDELTLSDWIYGEKANEPTARAKFGDVSFTYSNAKDGTYTKNVPTNVGTYYVKVTVPETENYTGLEMVKSFKISRAINAWINEPTITGWTYGEQENNPTAKAKFGDVTFTYSDSENGQYTDQVPTNAGTYYVKANVAETNTYTGLNSIVKFTVHPKKADDNTDIIIPDINNDSDVDNLVIKDGDKELINGTDYEVEKKADGNKTDVIITFIGNYTGTVIKSYTEKTVKEETKTTNKTPTSDNSSIGLFGMIGLLSVGCIAFMTGKKKEEK